jgi:hypothetical protein
MPWSGSQILPTSRYQPGRDTSVIVNGRDFGLHYITSPLNSFAANAHLLWRVPESPIVTALVGI